MYLDDLVFRPMEEKFARREWGTPFVIWKPYCLDRDLRVGAIVGKTWYKPISDRWMVASGEYVEHEKYGPQLEIDSCRIAATPYHEAVARALTHRISHYKYSEGLVFDWIRHLSVESVLRIWKADTEFMLSVDCGDQIVKDHLVKLVRDLRAGGSDKQATTYCRGLDESLKIGEWWRLLCWGGLLKFSLAEVGSILASGKLDVDEFKKDPYLALSHRQYGADNSRAYASWFDWIDYVARALKVVSPERRLQAVIMAALLSKSWDDKSIYVPIKTLIGYIMSSEFYVEQFEKPSVNQLVSSLDQMEKNDLIVIDRQIEGVYPRERYEIETKTARKLCVRYGQGVFVDDEGRLDRACSLAMADMEQGGTPLTDEQKNALRLPFEQRLSLITGLPGTGKTTALKAIVHVAQVLQWDIGIVAPTGIAARNCSRITGHQAWTVHRFFGWTPVGWTYSIEQDKVHTCDLLIVDETSMISLDLLHTISNGVSEHTRILFVGDPEQLPSISPGAVFQHLIDAGLPRVDLSEVHRQAAQSGIIRLAHDISKGTVMPLAAYAPDVRHIPISNAEAAEMLLMTGLPKVSSLDLSDFQILTPTNVAKLGTIRLNRKISAELNPGQRVWLRNKGYRHGDKILVTRNDKDAGIYNGELGILQAMDDENAVLDIFGARDVVSVPKEALGSDVDLGYAITIHKSQGSEFRWVTVVLDPVFTQRLYKNLVYTAVTRAKKRLDLLCSESTFHEACVRLDPTPRYSQLGRWVKEIIQSRLSV